MRGGGEDTWRVEWPPKPGDLPEPPKMAGALRNLVCASSRPPSLWCRAKRDVYV